MGIMPADLSPPGQTEPPVQSILPWIVLHNGVVHHVSSDARRVFREVFGFTLVSGLVLSRHLPEPARTRIRTALHAIHTGDRGPHSLRFHFEGARQKSLNIHVSVIGIQWSRRSAIALSMLAAPRSTPHRPIQPSGWATAATPTRHHSSSRLSAREREVASLAAEGYASINIAARLGLSEGTVRTHLRHAMRKSGAQCRAELALLPELRCRPGA